VVLLLQAAAYRAFASCAAYTAHIGGAGVQQRVWVYGFMFTARTSKEQGPVSVLSVYPHVEGHAALLLACMSHCSASSFVQPGPPGASAETSGFFLRLAAPAAHRVLR
jgi:hypothetical protein